MPDLVPAPRTSSTPLLLLWSPARAYVPLPLLFPQGGWPGLGSHCPGWICGCFEGQGLGPEEKDTVIHNPLLSPQDSPSPAGYLGQLPLNRGIIWVVEVGLPMLVLKLHPLRGEGRSGLPARLRRGEERVLSNRSSAWPQGVGRGRCR